MRICLLLICALWAVAPSAQTQRGAVAPECDRACLGGILDSYFGSIAKRDPKLLSVTARVRVTENAAEIKLGEGLWQRGAVASLRADALDPESGGAASMAVLTENGKSIIEFVRLKVQQKQVTEVETLIVRPGEGQRSDPDNMARIPTSLTSVVPPAQRATRQQLIAAGDAYLDGLSTSGAAYVPPPIAEEALRFENGVQSTGVARPGRPAVSLAEQMKGPRERTYLPPGSAVIDRRYPVMDLERGISLVIGTMRLQIPPGVADGPPLHANPPRNGIRVQVLVEYFKVVDGKIQRIEAVMYDLDDPKYTTSGWPVS